MRTGRLLQEGLTAASVPCWRMRVLSRPISPPPHHSSPALVPQGSVKDPVVSPQKVSITKHTMGSHGRKGWCLFTTSLHTLVFPTAAKPARISLTCTRTHIAAYVLWYWCGLSFYPQPCRLFFGALPHMGLYVVNSHQPPRLSRISVGAGWDPVR